MASQHVKWTGLSRLIFHCFLTLLVLRVTAQECSLRFVAAARLSSRVCRSRVGKRVVMLVFMSLSSSRVAASAGSSGVMARGVALLVACIVSSPTSCRRRCSSTSRARRTGAAWRGARRRIVASWQRSSKRIMRGSSPSPSRERANCPTLTSTASPRVASVSSRFSPGFKPGFLRLCSGFSRFPAANKQTAAA
mgnify:CR=1 FL=1